MKKILIFVLILFFLVYSNYSSEQKIIPEIEVSKITKIIYKLYVNNYVNVIAFVGRDGLLIIDTGFPETSEQLESKLKELYPDNVNLIINTHADKDHCGGNELLGQEAIIIAHKNCRKLLSEWKVFSKNGLPDITFDDTLTLHFNSEKLKIMSFTGCHSSEDIIVYFTKQNIVCMGDAIISDSFPFVRIERGGDHKKLLTNIEKLINILPDNAKLIISHGRDYSINDLRNYHQMLVKTIDIVTKAIKTGKNANEMKKEGILKDWESWNNKRHTWINTDLWIETIYKSLSKKRTK